MKNALSTIAIILVAVLLVPTATQAQTINWTGSISSNWSDARNWSSSSLPTATSEIYIPFGTTNFPSLIGITATVQNITIDSGVIINIDASSTINVNKNIINNGIITGAGTIVLNGTIPQYLSGNGWYSNITLDNAKGAGINGKYATTITGTLILASGTFSTHDALVLHSDSTGTARISAIATGAAITGAVTVQQYIGGGRLANRLLGHPFNSYIALSQLEDSIDITGEGGSANGFTTTSTNTPSAFRYDPFYADSRSMSDPGWIPFTSTSATIDSNEFKQYQGISILIRGAKGEGLDSLPYTPSPVTISMKGNVNTGNQTVILAKGDHANQDYNCVSNPYPSPTDIGSVISDASAAGNVTGSAFYVFNPYIGLSGAYTPVIIGSPYVLQANNSFEVRAAFSGATLSFSETNKSAVATESLLRSEAEYTTIKIYDTAYNTYDMLYLNFNDAATANEDAKYDALKMVNPGMNFYSLSADNQMLCVDARPYTNNTIIPIGVSCTKSMQFILRAENVVVPANGQLFLHDKYTNTYTALVQGAEYRFSVTGDAATQGNSRFEITTTNTEAVAVINDVKEADMTISPNPATENVNISFNNHYNSNTTLTIINAAGVPVMTKEMGNASDIEVNISLNEIPAGIYMVEILSGNNKMIQKLVKE